MLQRPLLNPWPLSIHCPGGIIVSLDGVITCIQLGNVDDVSDDGGGVGHVGMD